MENKNKKVTIIGIAGGTGSGKTTVVKKIVEILCHHTMSPWYRSTLTTTTQRA